MAASRDLVHCAIGAAMVALAGSACSGARSKAARSSAPATAPAPKPPRRVIVFVWDGLRPDSVDYVHTPRLARLRDVDGTNFANHHAAFPTSTMINAAAFATGAYPGAHGFYGNTMYRPGPAGDGVTGTPLDFTQPVFTEDHAVLRALDAQAVREGRRGLLSTETLFEVAHAHGLRTAAVGKSGPAFLQDYREDGAHGVILDENVAFPRALALSLAAAGFPVPLNTSKYPYPEGKLPLESKEDPTATTSSRLVTLRDGVTSDPRASRGSPYDAKNEYLMRVYVDFVLPEVEPDLSVIWLRNPDSTEHVFGPGSDAALDALSSQDALLGKLLDALTRRGLREGTDVLVASDHGHSTVSGNPVSFPRRALGGAADGSGEIGGAAQDGYSVSGEVRTADVLAHAGFHHVYDGTGCSSAPVLGGITAPGALLHPTREDDGSICGKPGEKYSTPSYRVPATLGPDSIVVARNGGSDYVYVPSHDREEVQRIATALEERRPYGAVFVRRAYGAIPGTLPLEQVRLEGSSSSATPPGMPDLVVSFDWTGAIGSRGAPPGTEYASGQNYRGMHGSTSRYDFHCVLIAAGPSFKRGFVDPNPSGNVDVAPTVARLFGFSLPQAEGRILDEALAGSRAAHRATAASEHADPIRTARSCSDDDPACERPAPGVAYSLDVSKTVLTSADGRTFTYLEEAKVKRR